MAQIKNRDGQLSLFDNRTGLVCVTDALFSAIVKLLNRRLKKYISKINNKSLVMIHNHVSAKCPGLLVVTRKNPGLNIFINDIAIDTVLAWANVSVVLPIQGKPSELDEFHLALKVAGYLPDEVLIENGNLNISQVLAGDLLPQKICNGGRSFFALTKEAGNFTQTVY